MKNPRQYNHPVGMAILNHLEDLPLSASELAERIDFPRDKIYYHIKRLENMDLIHVAKTKVINGITRKSFLKTDVNERGSEGDSNVNDQGPPDKTSISGPKTEFSSEIDDIQDDSDIGSGGTIKS